MDFAMHNVDQYTNLHNQWFQCLLHRVGPYLKILWVPFEHQTAHRAALGCHPDDLTVFRSKCRSGNEIIVYMYTSFLGFFKGQSTEEFSFNNGTMVHWPTAS